MEPNVKLMPVGQDVGDVSDNDVKPRTTPGREYLETDSFGLCDLATPCLGSLSTVELDTPGKRKNLETASLGKYDLETDSFGNYSTVELTTVVATVNARVSDAVVPSRQSTSTNGSTIRSENGRDRNKLHKSNQIILNATGDITRRLRQLHWIMNEEIIIEDIIAKEAHDHPGKNKNGNWMVSGYETICRHSCFNVETVISILRPRVACAACDLAVADTNFFNWRMRWENKKCNVMRRFVATLYGNATLYSRTSRSYETPKFIRL